MTETFLRLASLPHAAAWLPTTCCLWVLEMTTEVAVPPTDTERGKASKGQQQNKHTQTGRTAQIRAHTQQSNRYTNQFPDLPSQQTHTHAQRARRRQAPPGRAWGGADDGRREGRRRRRGAEARAFCFRDSAQRPSGVDCRSNANTLDRVCRLCKLLRPSSPPQLRLHTIQTTTHRYFGQALWCLYGTWYGTGIGTSRSKPTATHAHSHTNRVECYGERRMEVRIAYPQMVTAARRSTLQFLVQHVAHAAANVPSFRSESIYDLLLRRPHREAARTQHTHHACEEAFPVHQAKHGATGAQLSILASARVQPV